MNTKVARLFVIPSFLAGAAMIFIGEPYITRVLISKSPRVADYSAGKIYEYNQHGHVVFLSWSDLFLMNAMAVSGVCLLLICGILLKSINRVDMQLK
ncbi:hypothetical protein FHR56_001638 [Xanthomonas sacchari]|uniref:hypothetical protein n=1 Tax=unclassified Xanthomonas TaxID=2643310 RepID=UPI001371E9D9|nr:MULTISPECIES: hypothetical protein [unclassified Xanthomonas]MBB6366525.1 hypothetical protein [Xanthomonas sp. F10]